MFTLQVNTPPLPTPSYCLQDFLNVVLAVATAHKGGKFPLIACANHSNHICTRKHCNSRGAALSVLRTIWNAVGLFYSELATEMKIKYALVLAFLSLPVNKVYGNC